MRLALLAPLLALTATACGAGRPAAHIDGCAIDGARTIRFPQPDSPRVRGATLGDGRRGVVFANGSGQTVCAWLPFAERVARAGFRVLVFDYGAGEAADGTAAAARELERRGARAVALVGASYGARGVVVAGARVRAITTVVALSSVSYTGDVVAAARTLRIPVLQVAATDDAFAAADESELIQRTLRTRTKKLVVVPGDDHGTDLLRRRRVAHLVLAWLRTHTRAP